MRPPDFDLGDPGSISVNFLAKVPGPRMELDEAHLDFSYASFEGEEHALEAYERLIHDVMIGDRTLFTTSEGIERLWEVSAPVLESPPPVIPYEPGSWGPEAIDRLIAPRRWQLPAPLTCVAVLFDVDGTLISSGGAGAASWRMAFDDLYGIPVDIDMYTDAGMTEPEVASVTFKNAIGHDPSPPELARLMSTRMRYLPQTVAESKAFRVLPGVRATLDRLHAAGYLLGVTTGGMEAAAHIKLARANLEPLLLLRRLRIGLQRQDRAHPPRDRARECAAR